LRSGSRKPPPNDQTRCQASIRCIRCSPNMCAGSAGTDLIAVPRIRHRPRPDGPLHISPTAFRRRWCRSGSTPS
jgi:hypothetical protein